MGSDGGHLLTLVENKDYWSFTGFCESFHQRPGNINLEIPLNL